MSAEGASEFGMLLRRYRRRSALTQEELAERAGMSLASVSLLITALELAPDEAAILDRAARCARSIAVETVDSTPPASAEALASPSHSHKRSNWPAPRSP